MNTALSWLSGFARHYLLAVQFFTRIPVTGRLALWVGFSPALLRASAAHFPGVGLLVGAVSAAVLAALLALLPDAAMSPFSPLIAAALSTVVSVMLTGGFHEDGLADVADGLGGSSGRERALDIMKDSRVGAFGALALGLSLLCKVALLALLSALSDAPALWQAASFEGRYACAALLAGHTVSRGLPLALTAWLPHIGATAASKSKPLVGHIAPERLWWAFLWCLAALAVAFTTFDAMTLIVACSSAALALLWLGRLFQRRLQGFTGDCLGAAQQVCEIAFYLGLAVSL